MRYSQFYRISMLIFLGSFLLLKGLSAQEFVWYEGRQPIVVSQETKDYILGLFQKGFAHRDRIISGQMDISYDRTEFNENGGIENTRTRNFFLAFDESRHRVEQRDGIQKDPSTGDSAPHVSIGCIGCYNGDKRLLVYFSRYVKKEEPASNSSFSIFDTSQRFQGQNVPNFWAEELNFIPQYIVYLKTNRFPTRKTLDGHWDLMYLNTLDMLDSGITSVTISDEDYQDVLCKKVIFETKWDDGRITRNSLWFAESQGYALRKHYYESANMYDELLEVDVALDKGSGIWFPSAWHCERNNNKDKTRYSEDGTIKNVVLNKPIDEKVFTMEDLKDIPAGAMVQWNTDNFPPPHGEKRRGYLLWDGNKIVTRGMFAESLVAKNMEESQKKWQSKRFRIILLVNIAGISLIVALILWRYYRQMR